MSINWVNILTISFPLQCIYVYESVCFVERVCVYVGETVYFVEVTGQNLKASLTGKPEIYENQWKLKEEEQKSER